MKKTKARAVFLFCIKLLFPSGHELKYTWDVLSWKLVGGVLNTGFCCSWCFLTERQVCLVPSLHKLHHRIVLAKLSTVKYNDKLIPFVLWTAELQGVQLTVVTRAAQAVRCRPVEAKGTAQTFCSKQCFSDTQLVFMLYYSTVYFCTHWKCTNCLQIKVCTDICKPFYHLLRWVKLAI